MTIEGLKSAATYEVVLENMSIKSIPIVTNTRVPGSPEAPRDVRGTSTEEGISLEWKQPSAVSHQFLFISEFVSQYETIPIEGFPKQLGSDCEGHNIKNLKHDTTYAIQVQEANSEGKGPMSPILLVTTKKIVNSSQVELHATNLGAS